MICVAATGALGRMGREVCRAVLADPELDLAGAVDPSAGGVEPAPVVEGTGIPVVTGVESLYPAGIDVLVDFTHSAAAVSNTNWALDNGIHAVVGTTGIPEEELEAIGRRAGDGKANVIIAPNFALGAVMMMKFAEMAAGVFNQCEIIELHHRGKRDSPSGTALATASRIEEAMRAGDLPPFEEKEVRGSRGGGLGHVRIHSVRLDGLVAHQEVIFGSTGQTLIIRHDTTDRSCFMPGVIMAVKAVSGLPGLTLSLEPLLRL